MKKYQSIIGHVLMFLALAFGCAAQQGNLPVVSKNGVKMYAPDLPLSMTMPTTALSFDNPLLDIDVSDHSPETTNAQSHGDNRYAPLVKVISHRFGKATATGGYFENVMEPGSEGGGYAPYIGLQIKPGARPNVTAWNPIVTDDAFFPITSCTRAANVVTCTLGTAYSSNTTRVGDTIVIHDNDIGNTYPIQRTLTAVAGQTVTFASAGADGTATGGELTIVHQTWGLELNMVSHTDPGPLTATASDNYPQVHGFAIAHSYGQPATDDYFGSGRAYHSFLCGSALTSCFRAGWKRTSDPAITTPYGFEYYYRSFADAGHNYGSLPERMLGSIYNSDPGIVHEEHEFTRDVEPVTASGVTTLQSVTRYDGSIIETVNADGTRSAARGYVSTGVIQALPSTGGTGLQWNGVSGGYYGAAELLNTDIADAGWSFVRENATTHARTLVARIDKNGDSQFGAYTSIGGKYPCLADGTNCPGTMGITATKTAGSCVFTITNGLITAVTGC